MKWLEYLGVGALVIMGLVVVFVQAGKAGGATGGAQASQIISASGTSGSQLVSALEGNG